MKAGTALNRIEVVDVNGAKLHYRSIGRGSEDLILIHGLAANIGFWNSLLLITLSRRFRITFFDLRGHGYSSMPPTGYFASTMAEDLLGLMDHLDVDKTHLVGHSFGGTVALHFAYANPGRVSTITLLDTRIKGLQPNQRLIDLPNWRVAKQELEAVGIDVDEKEENLGLVLLEKIANPNWKAMRERLASEVLFVPFTGRASGGRLALRWLRLLNETTARADFHRLDDFTIDDLRSIRKPILGIYGGKSRCKITGDRLKLIWPDCTLNIVPNAGHFFPATSPKLVVDNLTAFFDDLAIEDETGSVGVELDNSKADKSVKLAASYKIRRNYEKNDVAGSQYDL